MSQLVDEQALDQQEGMMQGSVDQPASTTSPSAAHLLIASDATQLTATSASCYDADVASSAAASIDLEGKSSASADNQLRMAKVEAEMASKQQVIGLLMSSKVAATSSHQCDNVDVNVNIPSYCRSELSSALSSGIIARPSCFNDNVEKQCAQRVIMDDSATASGVIPASLPLPHQHKSENNLVPSAVNHQVYPESSPYSSLLM
jgi:hypothetical protein